MYFSWFIPWWPIYCHFPNLHFSSSGGAKKIPTFPRCVDKWWVNFAGDHSNTLTCNHWNPSWAKIFHSREWKSAQSNSFSSQQEKLNTNTNTNKNKNTNTNTNQMYALTTNTNTNTNTMLTCDMSNSCCQPKTITALLHPGWPPLPTYQDPG